MLRKSCNMADRDNILLREAIRELRRRLPKGWSIVEPRLGTSNIDAFTKLSAPDRRSAKIAIEARSGLNPKGVDALVQRIRELQAESSVVVVSRYLSPSTRERLRKLDIGYVDLTGNVRLTVQKPGLYIETQGATEDPDRKERPARSLRGPKAGRIVRALVDSKRTLGVREIGAATGIDAGYVSRVLALLESEALITRVGRGKIERVDWPALLQRWAHDAPLESRGEIRTFLEPRGLATLIGRLAKSNEKYAVTGELAASRFISTTSARLASIWVRGAENAARRLALRPTDAGANVILIEPTDDAVFERAVADPDCVSYAAASQIAADLLTSPGRSPAEGERLIAWMRDNEEAWRG
jgi:hypothetical protein